MRYVGELVGWVGLNSVGASVRCQPFYDRCSKGSVIAERVHRYMPGLILS